MNARIWWRTGSELALAVLGIVLAVLLIGAHAWLHAATVLAIALAGSAAGLGAMTRSGALELAARCPQLDASGLVVRSRDLPWPTLDRAEQVLAVLAQDARGYASFLQDEVPQVIAAARRAVELHERRRLIGDGPAVAVEAITSELQAIDCALAQIGSQLLLAVTRVPTGHAGSSGPSTPDLRSYAQDERGRLLDGMQERTSALAHAVAESRGGRS
jgi:hypothetical protein